MDIYRPLQAINEDDVLYHRKFAERVGVSLVKMNNIIKECIKNKWITKNEVNRKGL